MRVKNNPKALRAAHRQATLGLDLGTRVNSRPHGYSKADRREGKNIRDY